MGGANHVLIQQPAKFVLKGVQKLVKGERIEMRSLAELHQEARWVPPSQNCSSVTSSIAWCRKHAEAAGKRDQAQRHHPRLEPNLSTPPLRRCSGLWRLYYAKLLLTKYAEMRPVCANTSALLLRITELFVYTKVEEDLAVLREHDYLSIAQGHAVKTYIVALCEELAESSVRIIDAIDCRIG